VHRNRHVTSRLCFWMSARFTSMWSAPCRWCTFFGIEVAQIVCPVLRTDDVDRFRLGHSPEIEGLLLRSARKKEKRKARHLVCALSANGSDQRNCHHDALCVHFGYTGPVFMIRTMMKHQCWRLNWQEGQVAAHMPTAACAAGCSLPT
jgi:hypothetical protein